MIVWEWQSLVTASGLLVGAFYLSSQPPGFPSHLGSARFAREIAFSTLIGLFVYVAKGGRRNGNEGFEFVHAVEWIENWEITAFCIPATPYIMFSWGVLFLINSALILVFYKLESEGPKAIFLSLTIAAVNIFILIHILELRISSTQCEQ